MTTSSVPPGQSAAGKRIVPRNWRDDPSIGRPSGASLFSQVLAVNTLIIVATVFTASVAAQMDIGTSQGMEGFLIASVAMLVTALVNGLVLRRRFRPLEQLIAALDHVDLERPVLVAEPDADPPADVARLRAAVEEMLARLDLERRRRASAVLDAQEAERARLARDLHDEVNQSLTGIMLRLSIIATDADEETRERLGEVRDLTEQAMRELLRLSHDLRPTALDDLGLSAALETRLRQLEAETDLEVQHHIHADLPELTSDQQTVVFRVAQEAISNVVQHAEASHMRLTLAKRGTEGVLLQVSDDGRGIPARKEPEPGEREHAGLTGMRERALLVDARLAIRSSSRGTVVELAL
ncbi:MAG: sensor histidine kinase [Solirubrobacteraceae bacterium]|nr:sensor histidine kinase [Solirubrobacteraceae bacterium]